MTHNIIFDMGHVLLWYYPLPPCRALTDSEEDAQALFAAFFGGPLWVEVDHGRLDGTAFTDAVKALLPARLHPAVDALYRGLPENILTPVEGMAELVEELLSRSTPVYLLSNAGKFMSRGRGCIPHIERFRGVMFSGDEGCVKPDPALYQRLMNRYHLHPEACFFVEDRADNLQTAQSLGWQTFPFTGDVQALRAALARL